MSWSHRKYKMGRQGYAYEDRMCMLLALRCYTKRLTKFQLKHEVPEKEVGKFNDIEFYEDEKTKYYFQLKHKRDKEKHKIFSNQLFATEFGDDYNLLKYVISVVNRPSIEMLGRKAIVLTNSNFVLKTIENELILKDSKVRNDWYYDNNNEKLTHIQLDSSRPDKNAIFDTSNSHPDAKYYKFVKDPNIVHILKRQSKTLSKKLRKKLKLRQSNQEKSSPEI